MPEANNTVPSKQPAKQMRSFWPLVAIIVVAIIAVGLILWSQFTLNTEYDLQSMIISIHRKTTTPRPLKKLPAPTSPATTATSSAK